MVPVEPRVAGLPATLGCPEEHPLRGTGRCYATRRAWWLDRLDRLACHWRGIPSQCSGDRAQFGLSTNDGSGIGIHATCEITVEDNASDPAAPRSFELNVLNHQNIATIVRCPTPPCATLQPVLGRLSTGSEYLTSGTPPADRGRESLAPMILPIGKTRPPKTPDPVSDNRFALPLGAGYDRASDRASWRSMGAAGAYFMQPQFCDCDWRRLANALAAILAMQLAAVRVVAIDSGEEFFERQIRPLLVRHCYECHSGAAGGAKGGLRLDRRAGIRQGGESGPAIVPGNPESSRLLALIESDSMPPDKKLKLSPLQKQHVREWITRGAPDPRLDGGERDGAQEREPERSAGRDWWSLRPVRRPAHPPSVSDRAWPANAADSFILERIERHQLRPGTASEPRALLVRLHQVLTGLPPEASTMNEFLIAAAEDLDQAWADEVDRVLASMRFGEHWARHWMDVIGYCDTHALEEDFDHRDAWRYRDYLIRAFNADLPFDQLIREQIAGDLVSPPRWNNEGKFNESLIGPAMLQMGEISGDDNLFMDGLTFNFVDKQIETVSRAFLATTVACARCHDHKLDPILTEDYYALAGVLHGTRWTSRTIDDPAINRESELAIDAAKLLLRPRLTEQWMSELRAWMASDDATLARLDELVDGKPRETEKRGADGKPNADGKSGAVAVPLEDCLAPWILLRAQGEGEPFVAAWGELAARVAREAEERRLHNEQHYTVWQDFRDGRSGSWQQDGLGLRHVVSGEFAIAPEGDGILTALLPAGLATSSYSDNLNGLLLSPHLPKSHANYSVELIGGAHSDLRTVVDNCFHAGQRKPVSSLQPVWLTMTTHAHEGERYRIHVELATKWSSLAFPRKASIFTPALEESEYRSAKFDFLRDDRSWFGVARVVLHDIGEGPRASLDHLQPLFAREVAPCNRAELSKALVELWMASLERWGAGRCSDSDVRLLQSLLDKSILSNSLKAAAPEVVAAVEQARRAQRRISVPRIVESRMEFAAGGWNEHVHERGDILQPGAEIPRGFIQVLSESGRAFATAQSGRMQLAEAIAAADNPLTARVIVNRIWHWIFGAGLVRSVDDFGRLGEPPSHPELLDQLADQFVQSGWSVKHLVRSLLVSRTFRQSGIAGERSRMSDAENRLLHHYPSRRLEAESLRDAMLVAAGQLNPQLYGPPVEPYRTPGEFRADRAIFSGPLTGEGRRSLYTKLNIMAMPRVLSIFDLPLPKVGRGARDRTSTPAQALFLLNDPFPRQIAAEWAAALVQTPHRDPSDRLATMFRRALHRQPDATELEQFATMIDQLQSARALPDTQIMADATLWADVASAIFCLSEFSLIP